MLYKISSSVLVPALIQFAVCVTLASPAFPKTWIIQSDHLGDAPTIQAGIDSAAAGDTVWAQPGLFRENLDFLGKSILVRGSGAGSTILDGQGLGSCVVFSNGEIRESVLEQFTITGGAGLLGGGGGIAILDAEPTIQSNRIYNNDIGISSSRFGGGILCSSPGPAPVRPLILDNIIESNYAGGNGGGIAAEGMSLPVIRGNEIRTNESRFGDGGGIWIWAYGDGTVVDGNVLEGNTADDHGGGIHATRGSAPVTSVGISIVGNLIADNVARGNSGVTSSGGGIWAQEVKGVIASNTIFGNRGDGPDSTWGGGGIAISSSPDVVVELNIVAYSLYGGGIRCNGPAPPLIRNNLAWRNVGGDGAGTCASWWQSNGNVVDNPYFCDTGGGDYTVASNSPAITHPYGPLGAFPIPGCGPVAVRSITWGRVKALYGSGK